MRYAPLDIPGLVRLTPKVLEDERGAFMETFRQRDFEAYCGDWRFVQENHSRSAPNVLRGLHYQFAAPQGKLVRVTQGCIYDVAVDLRLDQSTFGQWAGEWLSSDNARQLWIPPGFAHGFLVTSDGADVQYKCTEYYAPGDEFTIRWDDPMLDIDWPLSGDERPVLSGKDADASLLSNACCYPKTPEP